MSRLKILMVTGAFYPKVDGSVIAAGTQMRELVRRGHQVTLLTRSYGVLSQSKEWNGVRVERVSQHGFSLIARFLLVVAQVRRGAHLLSTDQFDLVHAHGFGSLLTAEILRVFRNVPVVVTFHGLQRLWNKDWSVGWFLKFYLLLPIEGMLVRRTSLVVAQSMKLKEALTRLYKIKPDIIRVIPNPVDITTFRFHPPMRQSNVVLFVGTIGTIYGPDILVRAAKHVLFRIPSARFVFVGAGPAERLVRELAKTLGIERSVELAGRVTDREELAMYYASSRMLVIPFRGRGGYILSLAALESMAVGRPVIMGYETDDTAGVINASNEPAVLAERIVEILSLGDEEYADLARTARSSVERFSSAEVASQLEEAYLSLRTARRSDDILLLDKLGNQLLPDNPVETFA